ncbi:hypothetical protein [Burkholderia mayonis]|uniref:Uncharacterized protein n=1 Tax=Burkholderia mayonis TaxID=1385591 RepID=A0A1B4G154_9BURK|nr:hypothetical protein [Burkholderia mayonis]AOJ09646.1 hypothetical protein WS71_20250 [Burkholderia mayonis]KVE52267.1 hypothetical protein WS71_10075 [Burkholderia mayonis]
MIEREITDLFGEKIVERISEARPGRKPTQPKGYAALPGTGPAGETCKTCAHRRSTGNSHARVYWKCGLMQHHWTGGPGTDIRMRSPACRQWAREES